MNKTLLLGATLLCAWAPTAEAVSYMYFQNNTSLPFTVQATQTGGSLSSSNWGSGVTALNAWQLNTEVMWANRDQGISNGVDFFFDVTLSNGGQSVVLKLKLNGNFVGSDMWQSASGPGFSHAWFGDRDFHESTFTFQGKTMTLKYHAYFTGGDDDILYVLQEHNPFPVAPADLNNANALNVLSYNIYMLTPPIAYTDQVERATAMASKIGGYDVVIFSEAFYNTAREDYLIPGISAEYPYHTPVVDEGTFNDDGGVFIASRWQIDTFAQIVYADCSGSDCLAAKGAMYVRIDKLGKKYHVFGTHTQAWNDAQGVATRILQFQQLLDFVQSLNIPADEPILIGGDLNVDKIVNNMGEYDGMLDSLDAIEPTYIGHPYTYDITYSYYTSGTVNEFLDYVLPIRGHQTPHSITNEPIILRSIDDDMWDMFELSDHFAIKARAEYPVITLQPVAQTVCEGDAFTLETGFSTNANYQWYLNGQPLNGGINAAFTQGSATLSDAGNYYCEIIYNNGSMFTQTVQVTVIALPATPTISQSADTLYASAATGNEWLDGNGNVVGTDAFFVPTNEGIYTVQNTENGCTSAVSAPFNFVFSGISQNTLEGIRLYPNPTRDWLNIENPTTNTLDLRLYNLQGQLLWAQTNVGARWHSVSLAALPQGIYTLQIVGAAGTKSYRVEKVQ